MNDRQQRTVRHLIGRARRAGLHLETAAALRRQKIAETIDQHFRHRLGAFGLALLLDDVEESEGKQ